MDAPGLRKIACSSLKTPEPVHTPSRMAKSGLQAFWACLALGSALFSQPICAFDASIIARQNVADCLMNLWPEKPATSAAVQYNGAASGQTVQGGKKLRILMIGDSITVGVGGDSNWNRRRIKENLGRAVTLIDSTHPWSG